MKRSAIVLSILLVVLAVGTEQTSAACPTGTYEWVDQWGNPICKSFDTGQTRSIQGTIKNCPTGTYQWVDEWGNQICKSFGGNQRYYDTSKGCPVGTYEWVDNWGNKICKPF